MFASKFITQLKGEKKIRAKRIDVVGEQVKKVLQNADQQIILMVRG